MKKTAMRFMLSPCALGAKNEKRGRRRGTHGLPEIITSPMNDIPAQGFSALAARRGGGRQGPEAVNELIAAATGWIRA
jgi:hypothetical protein